MKIRLKSLLFLFIIVLIYAVYYWVVPLVVDLEHRVDLIKSVVKKEFGADVKLQNPKLKMGLTPSVWLEADEFALLGEKNAPLEITKPKIKIKLLPLIIGKVHVGYFSCEKINARLRLDKSFKLYIGDFLIMHTTNPKISLENSKMNVDSYNISFDDETQHKKIVMFGDYFDLAEYNSKKHIKFSTNTKLKINEKFSTINADVEFKLPINKNFNNEMVFDGTLTNLDLSDISPYLKKLSKNKIKQVNGKVNVKADTKVLTMRTTKFDVQMALDDFSLVLDKVPNKIESLNKLTLLTTVNLSKNSAEVEKFKILSKNIDFNLFGKLNHINSDNPYIDLTTNVQNSRIEAFVGLLPAKNFSGCDINFVALKKYGYFGDIKGTLSIKRRAKAPKLYGNFLSQNGYVIKPLPSDTKKATVKLDFLGEKISLDINVPVNGSQQVWVRGLFDLYKSKEANLSVSSTPFVDLQRTESVLNPLHEIFNFDIGPVPVMKLKGTGNINLKISGNKQAPHLFGAFNFNNTTASFNGINFELKNGNGTLYFNDTDTHFVTKTATMDSKPIKIDGHCSVKGVLDFNVFSNAQNLGYLMTVLKTSEGLKDFVSNVPPINFANGKVNFILNLAGKVEKIEEFKIGKNILLSGKVKFLGNTLSLEVLPVPIKNLKGEINFNNNDSVFDLNSASEVLKASLKGYIKGRNTKFEIKGDLNSHSFFVNGDIRDIFQKNQNVNAKFNLDNFDLASVKNLSKLPFISPKAQEYFSQVTSLKGQIDIAGAVKNNVLSSKMKISDISFVYSQIPIKVMSAVLELSNSKLTLYKINAIADSMPVLVDGYISNIFNNPNFNFYINSKPTQKFIEDYVNKRSLYPLKIKGDIIYSARISGVKNKVNAKTEISIQEDSYIYYMGSTIGDSNNPIRIYFDANVAPNLIMLNIFEYDKLISSQNDKEFVSRQMDARGLIELKDKNIVLKNFRIRTPNPTDAKVFNVIFKKPLIKKGLFSANTLLNGKISSPKITGLLNFTGIDIPLLDTTIKDISLDFSEKNIEIKSKGEIFANRVTLFANMKNNLEPPYILSDVDVYFGNLDINEMVKSINKLDLETQAMRINDTSVPVNLTNFVLKNAKVKADSLLVKNIFANDLSADFSLSEKLLFNVDNFKCSIAQGKLSGEFQYNLLNANSGLKINAENVDANELSEAIFDLQNQIYGSLTGEVELSCNGKSHKTCMNTLSGTGGFQVKNGKMPKLGSLEYLLKAANLVKSGLTGLTLNSVIELVIPLKTGQFESINGNFSINSGLANSIQIFSKGKDLSLFVTGTYNFSTLIADMQVFGRLSKKISNALGVIGNTSINTLFNAIPGLHLDDANKPEFVKNISKIPGVELDSKSYRIFSVEIYGDINGDNYVQSFKWVE